MRVFICTIGGREQMLEQCVKRWTKEYHCRGEILTPRKLGCTPREFQRKRRIYADDHSLGWSMYVLADDDCLPQDDLFMAQAMSTMMKRPEFAILSLWPSNAQIHPWTPKGYEPASDDQVLEHASVGGIRFMRQGVMALWPAMEDGTPGYDRLQADFLRSMGHRVGYYKNIKMKHLGEGSSQVWNV